MENKNIFFLKDLDEDCVDAVIITEATKQEIENIIAKVKEERSGEYQWEDFINAMPEDTEIYDKWNHIESIYY